MSEAAPDARTDGTGLALSGVVKGFAQGGRRLDVLCGVDFAIARGEMVALVGPSGSGKSTLLHIAGLLERPDEGEIYLDGTACSGLSDQRRTELRRVALGFVYQYHHLLPEFSALENVVVPQMIAGLGRREAGEAGLELLDSVGLAPRANHRPGQLSGGEQQRVAIARALVNDPSIIMADEPTGNLDSRTGETILELIGELHAQGITIIIVTPDERIADSCQRIIQLSDGLIESDAKKAPR